MINNEVHICTQLIGLFTLEPKCSLLMDLCKEFLIWLFDSKGPEPQIRERFELDWWQFKMIICYLVYVCVCTIIIGGIDMVTHNSCQKCSFNCQIKS